MYQKIRLKSKRNEVYRVLEDKGSYIKKIFKEPLKIDKEVKILNLLKDKGCNVPKILQIYDNTLLLEDLGDTTLLDWYEKKEKENAFNYCEMIKKLCKWLKCFYSASYDHFGKSTILYDVNFRNFIIKDNKVFGLDFEKATVGSMEVDAGKLLAFSITYSPEFTPWKNNFAHELEKTLLLELKLNKDLVLQEKEKELIQIKNRRNY